MGDDTAGPSGQKSKQQQQMQRLLSDVMSDEDLEAALDKFATQASSSDVSDLLKTMNDQHILQWEDTKRLLEESQTKVVKCGLPEHQRPSEPENTTDVEKCIARLYANDPTLIDVNLNNLKRTPIPSIQKLIWSMKDNCYIQRLSMANVGIQDMAVMPLLEVLKHNRSLLSLNLETNYITGSFLLKLFKTLLENQGVEEVRVTNQGTTLGNQEEMDIAEAICENDTLLKVGLNFRRHEARNAIDKALYRNNELRRVYRQQEAKAIVEAEERKIREAAERKRAEEERKRAEEERKRLEEEKAKIRQQKLEELRTRKVETPFERAKRKEEEERQSRKPVIPVSSVKSKFETSPDTAKKPPPITRQTVVDGEAAPKKRPVLNRADSKGIGVFEVPEQKRKTSLTKKDDDKSAKTSPSPTRSEPRSSKSPTAKPELNQPSSIKEITTKAGKLDAPSKTSPKSLSPSKDSPAVQSSSKVSTTKTTAAKPNTEKSVPVNTSKAAESKETSSRISPRKPSDASAAPNKADTSVEHKDMTEPSKKKEPTPLKSVSDRKSMFENKTPAVNGIDTVKKKWQPK